MRTLRSCLACGAFASKPCTPVDLALAESRAENRTADMTPGDRHTFLRSFSEARADFILGADTEHRFLHLERTGNDAAMAGYIEGLASVRPHTRLSTTAKRY